MSWLKLLVLALFNEGLLYNQLWRDERPNRCRHRWGPRKLGRVAVRARPGTTLLIRRDCWVRVVGARVDGTARCCHTLAVPSLLAALKVSPTRMNKRTYHFSLLILAKILWHQLYILAINSITMLLMVTHAHAYEYTRQQLNAY